MPADVGAVTVRRVPVAVVRPLRLRVLRPGRPAQDVHGRGDDAPDTVHFAACDGDTVVGVMTLFPDPLPGGDADAHRIRWMAVAPDRRGGGIGTLLLREGMDVARGRGAAQVWANARDTALDFYLRNGFRTIGASYIDAETAVAHTPVVIDVADGTTGD